MLKETAKRIACRPGPAHAFAGFALIAFVALIASQPARGQDLVPCANDTDPAPTDLTFPGCPNPAACPSGAGLTGDVSMGGQIVSYFHDDVGPCDTPLAYQPNRCEDPTATCSKNSRGVPRCVINLLGLLYKPPASASPRKHAPAVVLVPGSTNCSPSYPGCVRVPEAFCGIKTFLLDHGYVVLEALPRGYGLNPSFRSTGLYVDDLVPQQIQRGDGCTIGQALPFSTCAVFDLEDEGVYEISRAVEYVKNQSFVAPDRVAVLGHSLGGVRTLALNTFDVGQKAVVTIAPDSESWCTGGVYNYPWQTELFHDVDSAKAPIYLLQPRNDVNLNSVVEFSHRAGLNREQFQAAIFPRVRDSSGDPFQYGDWAHSCFVTSQDNVDRWAPSVLDFIQRYGVK